jgi:hypothetical protein
MAVSFEEYLDSLAPACTLKLIIVPSSSECTQQQTRILIEVSGTQKESTHWLISKDIIVQSPGLDGLDDLVKSIRMVI